MNNYTGEYTLTPRQQSKRDEYYDECYRLEQISIDLEIQTQGHDVTYPVSFYYDVEGAYIVIESLNFDPGIPADLTDEDVVSQIESQIYESLLDEESSYLARHDFTLVIDHKWTKRLP